MSTDTQLTTAVRDALMRFTPTRVWEHKIQVDARGGTVVLAGVTRSRAIKETAENLARGVKGVSQVENRIVSDSDVEVAVAQALAADPRTRAGFPGILVGVVFGVVYLKGQVAAAEIKRAATEIAGKITGVQSVSNELIAPAKM
jgi:osmotically-inducible protein OsmY